MVSRLVEPNWRGRRECGLCFSGIYLQAWIKGRTRVEVIFPSPFGVKFVPVCTEVLTNLFDFEWFEITFWDSLYQEMAKRDGSVLVPLRFKEVEIDIFDKSLSGMNGRFPLKLHSGPNGELSFSIYALGNQYFRFIVRRNRKEIIFSGVDVTKPINLPAWFCANH